MSCALRFGTRGSLRRKAFFVAQAGDRLCFVTDEDDLSPNDVLSLIVCAIVDQPDAVTITSTWGDSSATLILCVHSEDLAKVIGRHGHTIRAIRVVMSGVGMKRRRRLKVLLEDGPDEDAALAA